MGFWDRIFKGQVFTDKRKPNMVCQMRLCGAEYILAEFELNLDREAQDYMSAYAVFDEPVNAKVESWIMNSSRRESGNIRFYNNHDLLRDGTQMEIVFSNAVCTSFRRNTIKGNEFTTINMLMHQIKIAGEEF